MTGVEFFCDRDLGRIQFPGILRSAGLVAHVHDDHFPQNAPDDEWIVEVARRGWIVLSADIRIRRSPLALHAIMTTGARVLLVTSAGSTAAELAANVVNTFPGSNRSWRGIPDRSSPRCPVPPPRKRSRGAPRDRSSCDIPSTSG